MEPELKKIFGPKGHPHNSGTKYFSLDTAHVSLDTRIKSCSILSNGSIAVTVLGPPDCDNATSLSKETATEFMKACKVPDIEKLSEVSVRGFYEYRGGVDLHYKLIGIQPI